MWTYSSYVTVVHTSDFAWLTACKIHKSFLNAMNSSTHKVTSYLLANTANLDSMSFLTKVINYADYDFAQTVTYFKSS